jgi:hypothetical protein
MKINTDHFYQILNTVRKSNGFKTYLLYVITSLSYFITKLMRILNY